MASDPYDIPIDPPVGMTLRRPTWDDLDHVAELYSDHIEARTGIRPNRREDIRQRWLEDERFSESLLVIDQGALVAFAMFHEDRDPWTDELDLYVDAVVHPKHVGRGLATFLLRRAERRARTAQPTGVLPLRTSVEAADDTARDWYERHGFVPIRHFLRMQSALTDGVPNPVYPAGVTVRTFDPEQDAKALWRAMQVSFADHWDFSETGFSGWQAIKLGRRDPPAWDHIHLAVGLDQDGNETIVGAAIARPDVPDEPLLGYVEDLAVLPEWRGQGIATALLRTALRHFAGLGYRRGGLEVDDITLTGAVRVYERAGMSVVRRIDVYEKQLTS